MQGEFPFVVNDGMAGVSAALITDHDVVILRQQVDHAAFSFIAPVDANHSSMTHFLPFPFPRPAAGSGLVDPLFKAVLDASRRYVCRIAAGKAGGAETRVRAGQKPDMF